METVPWSELRGKHLVIEEKMDGANCGISFTSDGELLLQSRGHYLHGGPREKQFEWLKQWSAARQTEFFCALGSRYVMYGENLFAKHTVFYDMLPHYFMEFDILDTETSTFLSTPARRVLLQGIPVVPVHVLSEGKFDSLKEVQSFLVRSFFTSARSGQDWHRLDNLTTAAINAGLSRTVSEVIKQTDPSFDMEGLYLKWEEKGEVKGRYKLVRDSFTNKILDTETHWHDRSIVQNRLEPGAWQRMFE
jgi:hypothetical protein